MSNIHHHQLGLCSCQAFGSDQSIALLSWLNNFHYPLWFLTSHWINHTFPCQCCHILAMMFARMPICYFSFYLNLTSSTLNAVLADVSIKINPFSFANLSPSSVDTCLRFSRSLLFPISMITISGFPFCLTSSSHLVRWLKVSLLFTR